MNEFIIVCMCDKYVPVVMHRSLHVGWAHRFGSMDILRRCEDNSEYM